MLYIIIWKRKVGREGERGRIEGNSVSIDFHITFIRYKYKISEYFINIFFNNMHQRIVHKQPKDRFYHGGTIILITFSKIFYADWYLIKNRTIWNQLYLWHTNIYLRIWSNQLIVLVTLNWLQVLKIIGVKYLLLIFRAVYESKKPLVMLQCLSACLHWSSYEDGPIST